MSGGEFRGALRGAESLCGSGARVRMTSSLGGWTRRFGAAAGREGAWDRTWPGRREADSGSCARRRRQTSPAVPPTGPKDRAAWSRLGSAPRLLAEVLRAPGRGAGVKAIPPARLPLALPHGSVPPQPREWEEADRTRAAGAGACDPSLLLPAPGGRVPSQPLRKPRRSSRERSR